MNCLQCSTPFKPKPMGYNARYCSDKCKRRAQRARIKLNNPNQLTQARARNYIKKKEYPARYAVHLKNCRNSRKAVRLWKQEFKLTKGCVDCGYRGHFAALEFDHEGPKSVEIGRIGSIKRLITEIEMGQCKVRCANCHAIKTWERQIAKA